MSTYPAWFRMFCLTRSAHLLNAYCYHRKCIPFLHIPVKNGFWYTFTLSSCVDDSVQFLSHMFVEIAWEIFYLLFVSFAKSVWFILSFVLIVMLIILGT